MLKRKTTFNPEWTKEYGFIAKSRKDDCHAYCTVCRCDVDVSSKGRGASNSQSAGTSSLLSFFREATSPQDDKISAAELCKVCHAVKHHQSYRTKGVTSPYSIQAHVDYIKKNELHYSLATDASNKGTAKCFPIVVRDFHFEEGVQNALLDFYSDRNETSEAITNQLLAKLLTSGLNLQKLSADTADNASVNYGKHNSVYQKLKLAQNDVLAANCLAHILHNATRYAAGNLDLDIENIVLKVYSHFSFSASRTAQLREFCEFVEVDGSNLLRHVVTRWLSLLPSIDRMLKCWKPLMSYFQSLGEEECPKILWKCFAEDRTEGSEMYFLFLSHILKVFSDSIEALEAKSFSITSVFKVMSELKVKAKRYVTERYDFSESSFHRKMSKLSLTADVSYGEYSDAVQACKLKNIDMDGLYEEYGMVEAILSSPEIEGCQSEERYLKLFSKADVPLENLRKVCAYIFSIPCSNAHSERIFSMMSSAWRNERNRLDVESVKAELQICVIFTLDCTDMYKKFLSNKKLLEAARKGQKYKK
uniref:HAT C-terminal dimerisation domain-containing protein n=1 Tax=Nothobranchius furzeri TaxID=105023 RepID=A0A8C6M4A3_NOTFU